LLRADKSIRLNEQAWLYALSPDAASVAFIGLPSGKVYVVDISSGEQREITAPELLVKTLLCWSRDGKHLAVANGSTLVVASVDRMAAVQQVEHSIAGFGRIGMFSGDNSKFYTQNEDIGSTRLLFEVDLASGAMDVFMESPVRDARAITQLPGHFQLLRNGDFFSCAIGRWDGRLAPVGYRVFDFKCFVLPLNGAAGPRPGDIIVDLAHGIDGSGVVRMLDFSCLYSQAMGLTIVFRPQGGILPTYPVDLSKDKSFEVYDAEGRRVASFGGYGAMEGNSISDFDIHPKEAWAVTTATNVATAYGRAAGMITIWDVRTGAPLQRLPVDVGVYDPVISRDGSMLTVSSTRGIEIFKFS
jgi:WD40 repeat protein